MSKNPIFWMKDRKRHGAFLRRFLFLMLGSSFCVAGQGLELLPEARYHGDQGLRVHVPNKGLLFVQDETPGAEVSYRARVYVNLDQLIMSDGSSFDLFHGMDSQAQVRFFIQIKAENSQKMLAMGIRADSGSVTQLSPPNLVSLNSGFQAMEIAYLTGNGSGSLRLWVNGKQVAEIANIQNTSGQVEAARMGLLGKRTGQISGSFDLDEFLARRESYIGPLDCTATSQLYRQIPQWLQGASLAELVSLASESCPGV